MFKHKLIIINSNGKILKDDNLKETLEHLSKASWLNSLNNEKI